MTELSSNCLPSQLPGVVTTRHGTLQGIPFASGRKRSSNASFSVISNVKSCRSPNLCICINGFESEGFVHKFFVSRECSEHSRVHIENKTLEYFALLKEYISSVTSIKNLILELESFSEDQCNAEATEDENMYECDLSKVLNILERYRSDMKHMKNLEMRFKSFLKSEMLFLSHTIGLTLRGFTKFIVSVEHQVIQSVYMILNREIKNLICYSVDELCNKSSKWNEHCIHIFQLAGKFEKLAKEATTEVEKWSNSWRDRVVVSVSKRGGIRSQLPLLYLKKLSQPHLLEYIKIWLQMRNLDHHVSEFIYIRSLRIANHCIRSFYLLVFKGERFYQPVKSEKDGNDPDLLPKEENEEIPKTAKKNFAISLKTFRSKFFQDLWECVHKEESLISVFITTLLNSNSSPSRNRSVNKVGDFGKHKTEVTADSTKESESPNAVPILADSKKSHVVQKKVHWDDMVSQSASREAINSHVDSLWVSLARCFINQLSHHYSYADAVNQNWDFSLATMDPERASIVLSCLSVKKLRSDSGKLFPCLDLCHIDLSNWKEN